MTNHGYEMNLEEDVERLEKELEEAKDNLRVSENRSDVLTKELEEAKQQNDILTVDIEMGMELLKEAEEELEEALLKGEGGKPFSDMLEMEEAMRQETDDVR